LSNDSGSSCVFCRYGTEQTDVLFENDLAFTVPDNYPVTQGHTLIIPKRHVSDFFDSTQEEKIAILDLLTVSKKQLSAQDPSIEAYNIGINAGRAAGQTIFHLHVHLIPRRSGDVDNPAGGIRAVIPNKQRY